MGFTNEVWSRRRGASSLSKNLYALSITAFTALGILFSALMAGVSYGWNLSGWTWWQLVLFVVAVLGSGFVGINIFTASDKPAVSLFGYALMAGPLGLLLGPMLAHYTSASIVRVFAITTIMVVVLGIVGAVIPESLESWGSWLLGALVVGLVGYFAIGIFGAIGINVGGALTVWDWVFVVVFGALVVYDLNRAMKIPRTLDNSIDSGAGIFLDFFNIFVRLLALMGVRSS